MASPDTILSVKDSRFEFLDGLRGLVAFTVTVCHFLGVSSAGQQIPRAYLGVDFFFVLSGFIIAFVYERRLIAGLSPGAFITQRIIRLYPMIFFGSAIGYLMSGESANVFTAALSALCIPYIFNPPHPFNVFPLNGPLWSMFFEAIANLIFCLGAWRLRSSTLAATVLLSWGAMALALSWYHTINTGYTNENIIGGLPRVYLAFFSGVLTWRWRRGRFPMLGQRYAAVVTVALLSVFCFPVLIDGNEIIEFIMVTLLMPVLVLTSSLVRVRGTVAKLCAASGDMSYPLYLIHFPVVILMHPLLASVSPEISIYISIGLSFLMALLAYIVFCWIDQPLRNLMNRRMRVRNSLTVPSFRVVASINICIINLKVLYNKIPGPA